MSDPAASILRFENVSIESGPLYETGMWSISFALKPGDLLLVRLETEHARLPLADAAVGLARPTQGRVMFLGEDWQTMSPDRIVSQRGKVGRIFDDGGWLSSLTMEENILLAQRHHTLRTDDDIISEALTLARLFGLPGLPRGRPEATRRLDLQKAACIRAMLGHPQLILLERPARGVYADLIAPLINVLQSVRRRGAAAVWVTDETEVWANRGLRPSARAKVFGAQLHWMETEA